MVFFFSDRSLSREILFPSTNFLSAQSPFEDGIREVSFLPRFVPNKPCVERASACQARACTGAEGFIHSEESVLPDHNGAEVSRRRQVPGSALGLILMTLIFSDKLVSV